VPASAIRIVVDNGSGTREALIGAASALLAAIFVGIGAFVVQWRKERQRWRLERIDRLSSFYAAANIWGSFVVGYPDESRHGWDIIGRASTRVEIRRHEARLLERLWAISDGLWETAARLTPYATDPELDAVRSMLEHADTWELGKPMPQGWTDGSARLAGLLRDSGGMAAPLALATAEVAPPPEERRSR
jgi:hypothetical protein